jgi:hypothetical protein
VEPWLERKREERKKTRISMNESRLKIRPNSSIEICVFLSSHFLSLEPSKGLKFLSLLGGSIIEGF